MIGRKLLARARQLGRTIPNPYEHGRAFTYNPPVEDLDTMLDLLECTWGTREVTVMDPMAGGGSIPFEALRYGFTVLAGELNLVASVILKATLDYPARFGPSLTDDIRKWGGVWAKRVEEHLTDFFPWLGEIETAEEKFAALIDENPDWAWGYIGWSDECWLSRDSPKDYDKGEAILQRALDRPNLEDRGDVLDRLHGLRQERAQAGRPRQRRRRRSRKRKR